MRVIIKSNVGIVGGKALDVIGTKKMDTGIHLVVLNDDGIEYLVDCSEVVGGFICKVFKNGNINIKLPWFHFGAGIRSQKPINLKFSILNL